MSLVLDASLTVAWYFEGEGTAATDAVLDQVSIGGAMALGVWPLEVANALLMAVRRKRIDGVYRDAALAELAQCRSLPLATLDGPLRTAAEALEIRVLG